jgi:hypothetical protein
MSDESVLRVDPRNEQKRYEVLSGIADLIVQHSTLPELIPVASGQPYELTAETAAPCHVNFVQREALLALLERFGEAACVLRSRSAASSSLPIATSVI